MEKQSKFFFAVFLGLVFSTIGSVFYRTMIGKTYLIEGRASCDPASEKCFVHYCDATSEECAGDPAFDTVFYKLGSRRAGKIPLCDPRDMNCHPFACKQNEEKCQEILCDKQTIQEVDLGDECNDPVQYLLEQARREEVEVEENGQNSMEIPEPALNSGNEVFSKTASPCGELNSNETCLPDGTIRVDN